MINSGNTPLCNRRGHGSPLMRADPAHRPIAFIYYKPTCSWLSHMPHLPQQRSRVPQLGANAAK